MRRSALLVLLLVLAALGVPASAPGAAPPPAPGALLTDERERAIAPGLTLATFQTYDRRGWVRWHLLTADLAEPALSSDLLGGTVTGVRTLSTHAADAGAVAGINGDYFDINETNAAVGPEIGGGALRKGVTTPRTVAGVGEDEVARLADLALQATVKIGARERAAEALNSSVPANGLGAFTGLWGPGRRSFAAPGSPVTEVVVHDGKVAEVRTAVSADEVPAGGLVLVGRGAAAQWLAGAQLGEAVRLEYAPKVEAPAPFTFALGSGGVLVRGGQVLPQTDNTDAGRTAIGWRKGGKELLLLAVDGRANFSRGVSFQEVADLYGRLGAEDAFMLDGGGSTTMVARVPGDAGASLTNTPSDGNERVIPNGVGLFAAPGSGRLAGFDVRPGEARVFPGLSRDFTAEGYDDHRAGVDAPARFKAKPGALGRFDGRTFTARHSGAGDVVATPQSPDDQDDEDPPRGTAPLTVLGPLTTLDFDVRQLGLEPGDSRLVTVTGEDAEGFAARVEPRDIELEFDESVVSVNQEGGRLRIAGKAEGDGRGTVVRATVGDVRAVLPVTVGLRSEPLSSFDVPGTWYFSAAQGSGSVATVDAADRPGAGADNKALALNYDFRNRTGTSAAYANAGRGTAEPLTLPPGTQRLALWVKGDGRAHWLRATLRSQGTTNVPFTFAVSVDWTGWRRVEGVLPTGFSEPITLRQIYLVETSQLKKDAGGIVIDGLDARVGQSLDVRRPYPEDPFVLQQGPVDAKRARFAVLSDAHTTAAAGRNSFSGRQTIQALREIAAARPEFLIVSGDGVDTNKPEDFAFFEGLLDEFVPDIPVHWVPGNHESGSTSQGTLATFQQVTGRPLRQTFDHRGVRFITLNSHLGSLRLSDFEQLVELREQLASAASDPGVKSVVLVEHHPPTDASGGGASQLSDPLEAGLLREWLADFRESSGKNVALLAGHAHTMGVDRTDGVLEVGAPVVGKTPYGPADRGGFFGWMLIGADTTPEPLVAGEPDPDSLDWLRAEVRPIIDGIELSAPATLGAGRSEVVSSTGVNADYGLRFPLDYPASATWSGDSGLAVVRGERMARAAARFERTIATLDLETMRLTGVRPGRTMLKVAAAGQAVEVPLEVTEDADGTQPRTHRGGRRFAGLAAAAAMADEPDWCMLDHPGEDGQHVHHDDEDRE